MSYSIIFETKIVKLTDGRIIHFDRSGCNNDNAGRSKDDFTAKIYNVEDFIEKAEKYKQNSKPYAQADCMDLKIGSRYATMYDYGEHLLRMFKRAENYNDFITNRHVEASYCSSVEIIEPEEKLLTPKEFDDYYYKVIHSGRLVYRTNIEYLDINSENEIVAAIEANDIEVGFYIGGKR